MHHMKLTCTFSCLSCRTDYWLVSTVRLMDSCSCPCFRQCRLHWSLNRKYNVWFITVCRKLRQHRERIWIRRARERERAKDKLLTLSAEPGQYHSCSLFVPTCFKFFIVKRYIMCPAPQYHCIVLRLFR